MITWPYLAGFFDGDGCLSSTAEPHGARNFARAQFTQSGPLGTRLLTEIMEFLAGQGIDSTVITKQRIIRHHLISNDLVLRRRASVSGLIEGMMPWLRVKKVLAQDYQRYFTLYPRRSGIEQTKAQVTHRLMDARSNFWAYMAGFFDAEGCVIGRNRCDGSGNRILGRVSMGQSGEAALKLFPTLRDGLARHGVRSSVVFSSPARGNEQVCYRLDIINRVESIKFMQNVLPYLYMKKVIVQDHLRYFTIFPQWNMPWNGVFVPDWDLLADHRAGLTLGQIAEKRGIARRNVFERLKKIRLRKAQVVAA